jgi:hypothetical protein
MKNLLFVFSGTLLWVLAACTQPKTDGADATAGTTADSTNAAAPVEFADQKYMDAGKKMFASMAAKDMDTWITNFTDDAIYRWNNGDSLAGKPAIYEFWSNRFSTVVETVSFGDQIFLPVQVNTPQATERTGTWLLCWFSVDAKYVTGKNMKQWMHMVLHYNENDKIDEAIQYLDNVPIAAAATK